MKIVKVTPANESQKTQLVIEMTPDEAVLFSQALTAGKLAPLGITSASIAENGNTESVVQKWTKAEHDKQTPPGDAPSPNRR